MFSILFEGCLKFTYFGGTEVKKADERKLQELIQLLKDSFYVDDCISSVPDVDEAEIFRTLSTDLLKKAGMEFCKWRTNFGLQSESG